MAILERKIRFVNTNTQENKLYDFVVSKQEPPCCYSVEELNRRAETGIKDAEAGLGKSIEDMKKKHPLV
jgi:hypothetical protein